MRLAALVALVMVAFAANSILNRMALQGGEAGPAAFAAIRLASGAMALVALAWVRGQPMRLATSRRALTTAALALYVLGFSFAYVSLDAGIGALILFGGVQVTMGVCWAVTSSEAHHCSRGPIPRTVHGW